MKKKHLFICHAGQHMIFAQCIAMGLPEEEEKILWLCPQSKNSRLWDTFEALEVPGLWTRVEKKPYAWKIAFPSFGRQMKRGFYPLAEFYFTAKKLREVIRADRITKIWICHPSASFCAVAADAVKQSGGKVCFFEEGLSVYQWTGFNPSRDISLRYIFYNRLREKTTKLVGFSKTNFKKIIEETIDEFCFVWPENNHIYSHLKDKKIISLLDFCDANALTKIIQASRIGNAMERVAKSYPLDPFVLLLLSVEVEDSYFKIDDYLAGLERALENYDIQASQIVVKKHPRSSDSVIAELVAVLEKLGLQWRFAEESYPVPIELLYPLLNCKLVIGGISSPLLYLPEFYGAKCVSVINYLTESAFSVNGKISPQTKHIYARAV